MAMPTANAANAYFWGIDANNSLILLSLRLPPKCTSTRSEFFFHVFDVANWLQVNADLQAH
jgi:hypothetical protein